MDQPMTLFVSTFTTLLAIINPFEYLPVFLRLMERKDERAYRKVARQLHLRHLAAVLFPASVCRGSCAGRDHPRHFLAMIGATFLFLPYGEAILGRIGPRGIDAAKGLL